MFDNFFDGLKISKNVHEKNPYRDDFFDARLAELETRVDKKRYVHTLGVIEMAEILAIEYGVDIKKAKLAALLHDWDKCYTDEEMRDRIYEVGADSLVLPEVIDKMPKIMHGTTAAFALGIEYPHIPTDVLKAVINHTTGDVHMDDLDMIIYIADAIDPSRKYPEYDNLVGLIGKVSLHDLFVKTFAEATKAIIKKHKILHPKTSEIWNHHLEKYKQEHKDYKETKESKKDEKDKSE